MLIPYSRSASERILPLLISLVMAMLAMSCYSVIDTVFVSSTSMMSSLNIKDKCHKGHFIHQDGCSPHLGCNEILEEVQVYDDIILTYTSSRMIKLAKWQKKLIKYHTLNNLNLELTFRQHLSLFKEVLNEQLIGYCDAPGHMIFITDHHKSHQHHPHQLYQRVQLCSSYAELLVFLHQHEIMLDFDDEDDLLESVIIGQDPWRLILDDVFLLRPLNHSSRGISDDIWMTPEVCNAFLLTKDKQAKLILSQIHRQCRDKDPDKRPTADQLLKTYKDVQLQLLSLSSIE